LEEHGQLRLRQGGGFPNELGPAVVAVDVPEEVVRMARSHHCLIGDLTE
jgi:hypothetical protein